MNNPESPPTILVVDDDRDVREAVAELLDDHGYRAVQSADGREAEAYLRDNPSPACVVLDLMMPRLDGWAVAALMRQGRLPQVPLIVMTAAGDQWGYPTSPERLLKKPVDPRKLVAMVQSVAPRAAGRS
jgi:CheY-like chemotaxis protein